ncbi:hypothetical protein NFI96_018320 [Prochilodus magdalenae]|nr:hypothetical protein NFI96_018320 [Prochilodus magdalenae]
MHNVPKTPPLPEAPQTNSMPALRTLDTPPQHKTHPYTWRSTPQCDTSRGKEDPQEDQPPEKVLVRITYPGRVLRECADQISEGPGRHFQRLPHPGSCSHLPEDRHHHPGPQELHSDSHHRRHCGPTPVRPTGGNRSTDDAISSVVHTALTHLEQKDSYVRMLFVDFTSAFNTMIPQTLTDKLSSLGLRSSLCNWVLDFLTKQAAVCEDPQPLPPPPQSSALAPLRAVC